MASLVNTIHRRRNVKGEDLIYYPIVVIGAGESGIAAGCRIKSEIGTDQFRIFERRAGAGGVWYTSRYPGVAADVPALFYSFSFAPKENWSDLSPPGKDVRQYLNDVLDQFRVRQNLVLNTDVVSVKWIEAINEWEIELVHLVKGAGDLPTHERNRRHAQDPSSVIISKETIRAKCVVSCVGALVEPNEMPRIPGQDQFKGRIVHSSYWDESIDVRDKNVIVIGTGSSGTQIVPALIKPEWGAKSVLNILRSPPWVERNATDPEAWDKWVPTLTKTVPGFQRVMRKVVFATLEMEFRAMFDTSEGAAANRQKKGEELLDFLHKTVPEKYHEQLTPDYEVFCKRRVMGEKWFRSLNDDRVDLTTLPLTRLTEKTAILGPGRMYPPQGRLDSKVSNDEREVPVDLVVVANGYDVGSWLHPLKVHGRAGASLHDIWEERGGAQMYLGQSLDGFPNFFIVHGPNTITGHSSVILASEMMIQHMMHFLPRIMDGTIDACEVSKEAAVAYTQDVQSRLKSSVWVSGGCNNWYTRDGWNSTVYPRSQIHFAYRCKNPRFHEFNAIYTKKGIRTYKSRMGKGMPRAVRALPEITIPRPIKHASLPEVKRVSEDVPADLLAMSGGIPDSALPMSAKSTSLPILSRTKPLPLKPQSATTGSFDSSSTLVSTKSSPPPFGESGMLATPPSGQSSPPVLSEASTPPALSEAATPPTESMVLDEIVGAKLHKPDSLRFSLPGSFPITPRFEDEIVFPVKQPQSEFLQPMVHGSANRASTLQYSYYESDLG